ncbi:MAG: M2 family metallopeptidase [Candidatus Gastranaerophilaceae bacterium]
MKIQNIMTNLKIDKTNNTNKVQKTKPMPLDSVSFSNNIKENEQKFIALRENISKDMKPIMSNSEAACWDFYTESTPENMNKMNAAQDKANDFYDNKEIYEQLKEINSAGGVSDKKLKKQLRNLTSAFGDGIEFKEELKAMSTKENEISQKLNSYQMTIDGKPVSKAEISKIMETEKNPEIRKKASEAKIKSGDLIAEDLVELVKMRNDFAKKKGYDNYFDYMLEENYDIKPKELDKLLLDVANNTKESNKKVMDGVKADLSKAFGVKPEDLRSYHFGYLAGDNPEKLVNDEIKSKEEVVDISKKAYAGMGYNVDKLPIKLDLFPRENKNTHGFSFPIEAGKDARILANLTNNVSSIDTLMHELGHSVFTVKTNSKLPYLEQDTTSTMTEAVAMMMGDMPRTEGLIKDKISPEVYAKFQKSLGEEDSKFVGSSMAIIDFERNMYKNPDQDLKQLWKDMSVKYKGRSEKDEATNEWATIPHFLSHPAYYQNYFRASLIKAQLYEALTKKFGNLTENKDTAKYLDENIFQYGGSKEDNEILEAVTGKPLTAEAFCNRINNLVK